MAPSAERARSSTPRRSDLPDAVTFAGYVPHDATRRRSIAPADVFALPSDFDNSPNVVLEAMACGLPVVATDVGGVREFVDRRRRRRARAAAATPPRWRRRSNAISTRRDAARAAGALNRRRRVDRILVAHERAAAARRLPTACCRATRSGTAARIRMKVAIRDDDTCYFTAPETLERVYHDVWDRVPVCLATVPFAIGYERAGIPREHWHSGEAFPLEQNAELVRVSEGSCRARRVDDRAARLHASGLSRTASSSRRRPIPSGASPRACAYSARDARRADLGVRAAAQRAVEARARGGRRGRAQHPRIVPVVPAVDAAVGSRARSRNWWRVRRFRASTGRTRRDRLRLSARAALRRPRRVRLPQPGSRHDARGAASPASRRRAAPAAISAWPRTTGKSTTR